MSGDVEDEGIKKSDEKKQKDFETAKVGVVKGSFKSSTHRVRPDNVRVQIIELKMWIKSSGIVGPLVKFGLETTAEPTGPDLTKKSGNKHALKVVHDGKEVIVLTDSSTTP